jgi:hypothetical protein
VTPVNIDEEDLIDFATQPQVDGLGGLCLPTFWVDKPASWFITAESRFRLHGINQEQTRYDFLVAAISKEAVSLVLDIVENPPGHHPYMALKERLLESHQLNDYQRVLLLLRMEPFGGRKPSELLAALLELCPRRHETSIFFTHLFLERLPAELRIMLGEDNHQNPKDVAKKADSLWALHKMHLTPGAVVASVDGSSSVDGLFSSPLVTSTGASAVAAVSFHSVGRGGRGPGRGGRGGCGGWPFTSTRAERSLRLQASRQPASLRLLPPFGQRTWRGFSTACVSTTSISESRPTTALPPATEETSLPGASWRHSSWPAGPHYRPALAKAFPG